MSVLIKGMEMPTSCYDCNCFIRDSDGSDYCCLLMQDIEDNNKRDDDCPLVEIPPHGRLIDADALRLLYDFNGYKPTGDMTEEEFDRLMCRLPVIRANIDDAPTIIEAEEGE